MIGSRYTFLARFFVGAFVMFAFDSVFTLSLGMLLQALAVVAGVFTVATPEFLSGDRDD